LHPAVLSIPTTFSLCLLDHQAVAIRPWKPDMPLPTTPSEQTATSNSICAVNHNTISVHLSQCPSAYRRSRCWPPFQRQITQILSPTATH
jgi:hypothetical protein